MTPTTSPSAGTKRAYQPDEDQQPPDKNASGANHQSSASVTSAFRNVSACNRCRVRKNRCDQKLPACTACEKANVRCVGYDPITKREIPRSYVYFLETRLSYFESLLTANNIPFNPPEAFDSESRDGKEQLQSPTQSAVSPVIRKASTQLDRASTVDEKERDDAKLDNLVSNIGLVSVQGASDHRYLGSTSGISFARVVLAAVKHSVSANNSERAGVKPSKPVLNAASGGTSMRDTYFGLQTKPRIKEAPFPDRDLGERLVNLYFEHANPQIPTLHRVEFMELFEHAYEVNLKDLTPRELYLLNIVFAIGAGIIFGSSDSDSNMHELPTKRARLSSQQAQPEEYHASAIVHLGTFLSAVGGEASDRPGGDLEELQAVLLLAGFALLRPVSPGLWYIVGVAVRLAVDLGLHYEDGGGIEGIDKSSRPRPLSIQEQSRRYWVRDLRRRLWWCTYTFDRLVSSCVGRPTGITDQVITTEFPSLLEDRYILKTGIAREVRPEEPTYKRVAHHYFRLRLLQSEILQVLQYQQAQQARSFGRNRDNEFMLTKLPSPFLVQHGTFRSWRRDIDQRLWEWRESAPTRNETGVSFNPLFLELNYWQAVIMLYRQSLSVPSALADEFSPTEDVGSPSSVMMEEKEDEDLVFLKCAEAGQKTLKIYRQLHRQRLVNYTYLATHHLFMAGISFLYAVWHSPAVRRRLTLDDFDFTVLAATSVLGDLMEKCPPAEACRDAFDRMSKATVQMCLSTSSFGFGNHEEKRRTPSINTSPTSRPRVVSDHHMKQEDDAPRAKGIRTKRPPPKFDMDLRELFPDELDINSKPSSIFPTQQRQAQRHPRKSQTSHPNIQPRVSANTIDTQIKAGLGMDARESNVFQTQPHQMVAPNMSPTATRQMNVGSSFMDVDQNSYNPDFMTNLPGMDFLNNLVGSNQQMNAMSGVQDMGQSQTLSGVPNMTGSSGGGWNDPSTSVEPDTESEWGYGSGFGVGVGMGLDFNPQHDWSDGQGGFDLFDGFFFGSNDASGPV